MRQFLAVTFAFFVVGGCSLIYNPNNLGKPADASNGSDGPDAEIVLDANPADLTVTDIEPNEIFSGQGVDGSPLATLVISGHNFVPGLTVTVTGSDSVHMMGSATPSFDGNYVAVQLEVDVPDVG